MGVHIYKYDFGFFDIKDDFLYYFLGFVAADGYVSDNEIEIGVSKKDVDILKTFRDFIVPEKPIYEKPKTNSVTLKLSMRKYMPKFKAFYGMETNHKGFEVNFPTNIPKEFVRDFIRGYIDGDGTMDTTFSYRGEYKYRGPRLRILGNKKFLTDLNKVTKNFIHHNTNSIGRKKGRKNVVENVYIVTYNFNTAKNLLHWIYDDSRIHLQRKYDKAMLLANMEYEKIKI